MTLAAHDTDTRFAHHQAQGRACHVRGELHAALECYEQALALAPDDPTLLYDLARVARDLGELKTAEALLTKIVTEHGANVEPLNALANVLGAQDRYDDATALIATTLARNPGEARLWCTMGSLQQGKGDLDQALASYREALVHAPALGEAHANLALIHAQRGEYDLALPAAERAVKLLPGNADARFNLATIRLALAQFEEGWRDYEARFAQGERKTHGALRRPFDLPVWDGAAVGERPLLLWGEQGLGEEIMFAALVPAATRRAARVVLECDERLVSLLARSFPAVEAVARRTPPDPRTCLPANGLQSATGSLCRFFRRHLAEFRDHSGYLLPDAARVAQFRRAYMSSSGERLVGISWRTRDSRNGRQRTTALADWLPILQTPGYKFIDLQYGDTHGERAALEREHGIVVHRDPAVDPLTDLEAQAAQIASLDLVITVQNATMYLANALGARLYAVLPHYRDWRWPVISATSPWLPSARPFVQESPGDWRGVIAQVAAALAAGAPSDA